MKNWCSIPLDPRQLRLPVVLRCGQSFRWRCIDGVYSAALQNRVLMLKQDHEALYYTSSGPGLPQLSDEQLVRDYFQLDVDLVKLYAEWSRDKRFVGRLQGVRILRQDPWETLCAFICSSNNNIKRISKMVSALCDEYGPLVATVDGQSYHDFPSPQALNVPGVEQRLRELGFGYRARYIALTAAKVAAMPNGLAYLDELRTADYRDAHTALLTFSGVGPKVADCVCLMSLDKRACVPVDTHVWQIAKRDYKMSYKATPEGFRQVQVAFTKLWGDYAGWAHSVLFAGDLSSLDNGINISTVKTESKMKVEPKLESFEPLVAVVKVEQ